MVGVAVGGAVLCRSGWREEVELHRVPQTSKCGSTLTITEGRGRRNLRLGSSVQSVALLSNDGTTTSVHAEEWTQLIALCADAWLRASSAASDAPRVSRALFLGVGGGVIVRTLREMNDELKIHCVELEPEVLDASQRFFGLPDDDECTTEVRDAAEFVVNRSTCDPLFDVIVVDCFTDEGLAPCVADGKLLRHLHDWLAENGVCLVNTTWSRSRGDAARQVASRLRDSFDAVYLLEASSCKNVIVISHQGVVRSKTEWRRILECSLPHISSRCPHISLTSLRRLDCVWSRYVTEDKV
ncbi:hypothetical protein AB1Y20_018591 [Prymnesium parvum]|uniref:PABS domain-containing protein n=1 Tax=Prymnesium parvum TaxID=97485 RepID=A0AB34JP57_PRYPA